jgi:Na+-transporting NADH:ubiquinone oxidoreductase subunit A
MAVIHIKRGLDLPIHGALASTSLVDGPATDRVALLPQESWGIKVKMLVETGQEVQIGTPLYCDRRDPDVLFTSPAAGVVQAINRGKRRAVLSVVIDVAEQEKQVEFEKLDLNAASRDSLVAALCKSGLWPNLRQRPFDTVAHSGDSPRSIFVTAMDTAPLAPPPLALLVGREAAFKQGLIALEKLSEGATFLCTAAGEDWSAMLADGISHQTFKGKHPAGNAGVHINALDPVGMERKAWHVDYQGVADIGEFLSTGKLSVERRVAVVGPAANQTSLVKSRRGAATAGFKSYAKSGEVRFISGSVLDGATANPECQKGFIGRFCNQLTLVDDAPERELLNWTMPVGTRWSLTNSYLAKFVRKAFKVDTDMNGALRAIVPIGLYERVMPMDILPTQLIKALASDDLETAEKLGVLELAEEDLALCQYVCPSKVDITGLLRAMLTRIEKEG